MDRKYAKIRRFPNKIEAISSLSFESGPIKLKLVNKSS